MTYSAATGARRDGLRRRRVLAPAAAAGAGLATAALGAACAPRETAVAPTPFATPVTVRWFNSNFNARQNDLFESTVRQPFESEHPNVHLDVTAGGGNAKFVTLVTSGQAPDAMWWGLPEFWTGGMLRPLNDLIARDK